MLPAERIYPTSPSICPNAAQVRQPAGRIFVKSVLVHTFPFGCGENASSVATEVATLVMPEKEAFWQEDLLRTYPNLQRHPTLDSLQFLHLPKLIGVTFTATVVSPQLQTTLLIG